MVKISKLILIQCLSAVLIATAGGTSYAGMNEAGNKGLFRVSSADTAPVGNVAIAVHDTYFSQKDLLSADFKLTKNTVRASLGYTPLEYLEASLGTNVESNQLAPSTGSTQMAQTSGDIFLNIKGSYAISPEFSVGGLLKSIFYTTFEKIGYEGGATSYGLDILATYDFTKKTNSLPLRATVNVGYFMDNTKKLTSEVPDSKPLESDPPVSLYASGIRGDNVMTVGIGVEVPLPEYYITPMLEATMKYASTYSVYKKSGNTEFEKVSFMQNPVVVTPGIRVTPGISGLNIDLGVDLGMSSTITEDQGIGGKKKVYVTPQWAAMLGISYGFTPVKSSPAPAAP